MTGSSPWRRRRGQGKLLLSLCCLILIFLGGGSALDNPRIVEDPSDMYVAKNEPAKLHCKAEGDPKPKITWYRNGQKVITNRDKHTAHRLLLEGGNQLFFLRIIHSKKDKPDVGTYYCNATNIHGSAISRNATLQIAVLREDFRENPESVTVAAGKTATFRCKPPKGEPEPKVLWHKDGSPFTSGGRVRVDPGGTLVISNVRPDDAGIYTCMAISPGGDKQSKPAELNVMLTPKFREMPQNIKASEDDTVELKCRATGDPAPTIKWMKEDGILPHGRARQLSDGTLRIEKVSIVDNGLYICVAENDAGTTEAVAELEVQTLPSFLIRPSDIKVGQGRTAIFQCVVTGNPKPTVFWTTPDSDGLLFSNHERGRLSVSSDGTLRIRHVEYRDEGRYDCQAYNPNPHRKEAKSSALLTVVDHDSRPPPIITERPGNQTVEPKEVSLMTCKAEGNPQPVIRWYKDDVLVINRDPRIATLNSGTLQISDVKMADGGVYTCVAISETGETRWKATLTVSRRGPFHRTHKTSALPGPPSKLRVSDITDTSVHLTWVPSSQMGESPVFGYEVELFSPEVTTTWMTASDSISREGYTVRDLEPDTEYVFLVRAKNSFGVSAPSPVSDSIRTREKRTGYGVIMPKAEIRKELNGLKIELKSGTAINETAVKVKWEVSTSLAAIEGYVINYTIVLDLKSNDLGPSRTIKLADPYRFRSPVDGLRPYTWYEVCVMAYSLNMTSKCSNTVKIRTNESVPSAPPVNVVMHKEENSFRLRWSPPPAEFQNGVITGYMIECLPEEGPGNCSVKTGAFASSLTINDISADVTYKIRIAATTSRGRGKWSKYFALGPGSITSEAWFKWTLVGTVGGAVWLFLCFLSFWMCRRKRRRDKKKKMSQNGMYSAVPVHKSEESARAGSVITREEVMYSQKDGNVHAAYGGLPSDLASLLECGQKEGMDGSQVYSAATTMSMPQMKTFYQRPGPPQPSSVAPYATTTLINAGGNPVPRPSQSSAAESGFRPINHAYVHSSASGSGDSCQKPEMRSSDSNTDPSRPNTGHYSYAAGCPHEHCEGLASPGSDSGSLTTDENGLPVKKGQGHKYSKIGCATCGQGKQALMNWAEMLPPPPEHPPPSEAVSMGEHPGDSSIHRHNMNNSANASNIAETRFIENRSPISPVSKISACSCPVPHERMVPHLRGNPTPYSDIEYPTHTGSAHPHYHGDILGGSGGSGGGNYHDGSGSSSCGGGGSGGSNNNSDFRPYSPKHLNSVRSQTGASDAMIHRCQSPLSCHNCGSSLPPPSQQQQQQQQMPPPSSSSSSYNPHHLHHHMYPENYPAHPQRPCLGELSDPRSGPYPAGVGGMYPSHGVPPVYNPSGSSSHAYSPAFPFAPSSLHGYRIPPVEDKRGSGDHERGGQMYPNLPDGQTSDRACQSSLASLTNDALQPGYGRRPESPTSEGVADYAAESDMEVQHTTDCPTPDSSVNGDGSVSGSMNPGWSSLTEDSDAVSHDDSDDPKGQRRDRDREEDDDDDDDSSCSSSDSSFLADTDFASAVARAAELSGLTVVGTTVSDPKGVNSKKYRKHRNPVPRPTSPYSTDSNMSAVIHKPYPKSDRKKQLMEQARKYGPQRKDGNFHDLEIQEGEMDLPAYHRPYYPTLPIHNHNNNNNSNNYNNGTIRSTLSGGYAVPMMNPDLYRVLSPNPDASSLFPHLDSASSFSSSSMQNPPVVSTSVPPPAPSSSFPQTDIPIV